MNYWKKLTTIAGLLLLGGRLLASDVLQSGDASLTVVHEGDQFNLSFGFNGVSVPLLDAGNPVYLEVKRQKLTGKYASAILNGDKLVCKATLTSSRGTVFNISDTYWAKGAGVFELQRNLEIATAASDDSYFNSLFGFEINANANSLTDNEYFIPSTMYKSNFTAGGNLPFDLPGVDDVYHFYREDRVCLPLVMVRKSSGLTIAITHKDSKNETVVSDANGIYTNANYQYGAMGVKHEESAIYGMFIYPGNEFETQKGKGFRYHPVQTGIRHAYHLDIVFSNTNNYADALRQSWNRAFALYNPMIYNVNLTTAYNGLIETLKTYFVPSTELGGIRDAPGFPWEVYLPGNSYNKEPFTIGPIDYAMGFVGMQISTAYYLVREGIEKNASKTREKGEAILNFWANNCLTSLGFPRTHYDPGLNGATGSWRTSENDLRNCTGGMEGLIAAYCFAKRKGMEHANWIDACIRFGNWLVTNQNADGSYYFSYNYSVSGGKHTPRNQNKYLTICAIRYLVELYIATGVESYKTAALKAGNFCYSRNHQQYLYVACVVDNPQTIDSESGLMAMNGFLALYDLTKDRKWLVAAEQAGTYTETWVYMNEVPVEKDRTTDNPCFPKSRSVVGQHLISIRPAAADLGFAWCSFAYYRLYMETADSHWLHVARIAAHNTKQSMNWDGTLYLNQPRGLQLEAFSVMIPRRVGGICTTLNWNYAAHLDPMFR
ncbi:MAG: AGE family epimerase/isomerase, partial [Candidatus Symbiothrix sp.]|nr:AGE family epimerase/isomerase [Candidatus Symbiothrix sp.]